MRLRLAATRRSCYSRVTPTTPTMDSSFGDRLRLQRERRQIALSTIADQTKIKLSLLEALERDDLSHWPLGIFGRSYIRAYAQAVGLDPAATVREFVERHPGSVEPTEASLSHVQAPDNTSRRPPTRMKLLIASAIDAIQARRAEHAHRSPPVAERSPSVAEPAPAIAYSESVALRPRPQAPPVLEPAALDLDVRRPAVYEARLRAGSPRSDDGARRCRLPA